MNKTPLASAADGIGGRIKDRPEDFLVDELPDDDPSGDGEHLWMLVEKRDATTAEIAKALANHFRVAPNDVAFAGIKDKRAITRQIFSVHVPGRSASSFPTFTHDRAGIHWIEAHRSKIRRGQSAGNRFSIRVRGVSATDAVRARDTLELIARRGLPNRFGAQRFGARGRNHLVGRALWLGHWDEALDHLMGPGENTPAASQESCDHFAAGRIAEAARALPRALSLERTILRALVKTGKPAKAWKAIRPRDRGFFITAFQSAIFNDVLERRVIENTYDTIIPGDLLLTPEGRELVSVPADGEVHRALIESVAAFERTPSGPMWGATMRRAGGAVDELEVEALANCGVTLEEIATPKDRAAEMTSGTRRPLRVPVRNIDIEGGLDEHGEYVRCLFDLPPGAFATEVMSLIMGATEIDKDGPSS